MTIVDNAALRSTDIAMAELSKSLRSALQGTLFGSRKLVTPRRLGQIAEDASSSFGAYLDGVNDAQTVCDFGRRLASDGFGHTTILALVATLQTYTWNQPVGHDGKQPAAVSYSTSLLRGYMEEREAYLLKEQEMTRRALDRARTQAAE
jgi:hypothetical protein